MATGNWDPLFLMVVYTASFTAFCVDSLLMGKGFRSAPRHNVVLTSIDNQKSKTGPDTYFFDSRTVAP